MRIKKSDLKRIIREAATKPVGELDEFWGTLAARGAALGATISAKVAPAIALASKHKLATAGIVLTAGWLASKKAGLPADIVEGIETMQANLSAISQQVHSWDGTPEQAAGIVQNLQQQIPAV